MYTAIEGRKLTALKGITQLVVSSLPTFVPFFRTMKQPLTAAASVIALIGAIILFVTPDEVQYQGRRLAAIIIISCSGVNYTVIMSVIGANVTGFTKKQLTTSATFFMYCIINIITPQTFIGTESPRYPTGLTFVLVYAIPVGLKIVDRVLIWEDNSFISVFIALALGTWLSMRFENARRDKKGLTNPGYAPLERTLEHVENPRYVSSQVFRLSRTVAIQLLTGTSGTKPTGRTSVSVTPASLLA